MVEFVHNKEEPIGADDSIIFKNNTKDTFNVGVGIIFHKSGLYHVVVDNKCTSVTEESERKKGKWIEHHKPYTWMGYAYWTCSECGFGDDDNKIRSNFCPNCGADMGGDKNGTNCRL